MNNSKLALFTQFAGLFGIGLSGSIINVAWPSIRDAFDQSQDRLGVLLLAAMIGFTLAAFVVGRLVDRFGVGWVLVIGGITIVVGLFGYTISTGWLMLLPFVLLRGTGTGLIDSGANIYAARSLSARLTNWLHACFGLGAAIGPLITTAFLSADLGWQSAYIFAGCLQLLLLGLFWLTRQETTGKPLTPTTPDATQVPIRTIVTSPVVWIGVLFFFIYGGVEVVAGQWSFTLFTEGRGVALEPAGTWISIYWGSLTVGRIVLGQVADWIGTRQLLRLSHIGALLGSIMLAVPSVPWLGFAGLSLLGFAIAPVFPTWIQMTPTRVGANAAATTIGFQVGVTSLGIALLPGLAGILIERISLEIVGPFMIVLAVFAIILNELMARTSAQLG